MFLLCQASRVKHKILQNNPADIHNGGDTLVEWIDLQEGALFMFLTVMLLVANLANAK